MKPARISRSLVTVLALSLLNTVGLTPSFLPSALAVNLTTGTCTVDGTNMSTSNIIDTTGSDGTCTIRLTSGTSSFIVPAGVNSVTALVVGGGGGGGFGGNGGGGGAGAVITSDSGVIATPGSVISGTVGGGGSSGYVSSTSSTWTKGGKGTDSSLTINSSTYVASGGGGGSAYDTNADSGGSGGGKAINGNGPGSGFNIDYAGWTERVFPGASNSGVGGGGGGGAGGSPATNSSNGAIGVTIWGYSVGGGGSGWAGGDATVAGPFGGGAPRDGSYNCPSNTCNGDANTGGGGGGGGAGGSGVIVIKFVPSRAQGTITQTNGFQVNRASTFTFTRTGTVPTSTSVSYQWQVKPAGSSTWSNVTTGTGATTLAYQTAILGASDNGNTYRIAVTDTQSTHGISTTTFTETSVQTLFTPPGSDTDSALSLNGSTQYAEISDTTGSPFDTSGTFTIQAWVNPATGCASSQTVIAKYLSYMLECYNGYWWYMNIANGSTGSDAATLIKVEQDEWHHIALTRSAGSQNLNFYYDGVLVQTLLTGVTNMTPNNQPFRIGQYNNNYFFNGQIDEVRIYNSQRTQAQIVQDMNSYGNVNDSELMVYYDFNEFTGSKLYNRKAGATSGSDLNILNSPLWKDVKIVDPLSLAAYTIVKFPRSYLTVTGGWRVPAGATRVSALVVAGGGGGGARAAGGGGAGGLVYRQTLTLSVGAVESITVGHGGLGGYSMPTFTNRQGLNGGDSQLGTHTGALGGGGGGGAGDAGNTYRVGLNGGSGGGASGDAAGNGSSAAFGYGQQNSLKGYGLGNNGGSGMSGTYWNGGGGGGSGGVGQSASTTSWVAGKGGAGTLDPVGGSNLCLAAGGGGGTINTGTSAGAGGTCVSGTVTAGAGTVGAVIAGSATANSGSGGGGSGYQTTDVGGGHGGSGVIIIRWITAAKPIFTQPANDTTTAGLTDTITVSADPIGTLIRNYQWQSSTDTGTTWSNIASNSGSGALTNTYTTPILDTSTSGSRYQYRVVVTDSDTAGLFIVDTSTAVFIVINPPIVFSGTYSSQKYGEGDSDTFTVLNGTGNKTFSYNPGTRPGITWSSPNANMAVVTVAQTVSPGTYPETITATDTRGAQTQLLVNVVVSKADTITVTALDQSDTYTGSALSFTPSFTVVGLKNSDTVTPISWEYTGADNAGTAYSTSTTRPMNAGSYTIDPITPLSLLDSYTAVTRITSTLTINRANRTITMTAPSSPLKYGDTRTAVATSSAGSGDGTISYLTNTSDSCTVTSTTIRAVQSAGSCSFTATISRGNNFETATTTSPVTTTLTKADTITVQMRNPVTLTYSGSPATTLPTLNIVGLVHTDTATATRLYSHPASAVGAPESYVALTNSATIPTDVETYTVSSSALTFSSGVESNYVNVVRETSTLIINQANQLPLQIAMYGASVGSPFTIVTDGGSGGGLVTETTTAGSTASNCAISSRVLTMTSTVQSFCNILVTKGASRNFKAETATAQITFYLFIPTVSAPAQGSGPTIALTGENDVTVDLVGAPSITSLSATTISLSAGGSLTIGGTGFGTSSLTVKFSRDKTVTITPANGTTIVVPFADIAASGGQSGRIMVITAGGIGVSVDRLTINP